MSRFCLSICSCGFSDALLPYWTAIINGLLAPFLLVGVWLVASDRTIMQNQPSSRLGLVSVGLAALGMFVF